MQTNEQLALFAAKLRACKELLKGDVNQVLFATAITDVLQNIETLQTHPEYLKTALDLNTSCPTSSVNMGHGLVMLRRSYACVADIITSICAVYHQRFNLWFDMNPFYNSICLSAYYDPSHKITAGIHIVLTETTDIKIINTEGPEKPHTYNHFKLNCNPS